MTYSHGAGKIMYIVTWLQTPAILLKFMANYIFIKEARAKFPLTQSIFLMLSCCPFTGQMGNSLSEWGQVSKFKGKPARGMNPLQ